MFFDLPDEDDLLRRTVREFAEGEIAPVAEELDRTKTFRPRSSARWASSG